MSNFYDDRAEDEYAEDGHTVDDVSSRRRLWLWVVVTAILCYAAYELVDYVFAHRSEPVGYIAEQEVDADVDADVDAAALLPGIYTVTKHFPSGDVVVFHAELCCDTVEASYKVLFVSGYSVSEHEITTTAVAGELLSSTLGRGKLSHKEDIERTTIIFNNKNIQWVLKK